MIRFESIKQVIFLKRGITCFLLNFLKRQKFHALGPVTYRIRDMKDDDFLGGFYDYELQKVKKKIMECIKLKRYKSVKLARVRDRCLIVS